MLRREIARRRVVRAEWPSEGERRTKWSIRSADWPKKDAVASKIPIGASAPIADELPPPTTSEPWHRRGIDDLHVVYKRLKVKELIVPVRPGRSLSRRVCGLYAPKSFESKEIPRSVGNDLHGVIKVEWHEVIAEGGSGRNNNRSASCLRSSRAGNWLI